MTVSTPSKPHICRFPPGADPDVINQAFREDGVVILEGFLTPAQVDKVNCEMKPHLAKVRGGNMRYGPMDTSLETTLEPERRRIHNLAGLSETFRQDILNHPLMHELSRRVFSEFGDYWQYAGSVIDCAPGTPDQFLHRDQPAQKLFNVGPDAPEGFINFLTALTDFTKTNGATRFVWGSHRDWIDKSDENHPIVVAEVKAGDSLFFSGKIVHGGSFNGTNDTYRSSVALPIVPCIMTPYEANIHIPRSTVETMTPLAQRMIGWRSACLPDPYAIGTWTLNMNELGEQMGLKSKGYLEN
ncbi:phytanoyl-CoA dioxygenase family protein [Aspergillus novofumigatus IBT 16806]|uniref:Fe(II)/2-oxoglutarate-dependent dioxygenase nvfF n=1 Tax=Aspergillus novofumigatus (strain IBT 16806) TaxID=1392255 RepID=NVFF_ASPN1|nr:putative oxygenase [Aspergillus novofumigatus IBT 16806]A0A2I1BSZ6.1 RecName: Full=Fe(II)/2-oxoglutarate-dependent dioxygenase nvfF; AltName: Full=Novofumigatoninbiosynthesis cluster protein F [Aspergillus novofumigatus IBT 16806]PKX88482.1 putative oxygenase [Aspergillus novofumigatus IBT 16806]